MSKNKILHILALFLILNMVVCTVSATSNHTAVSDTDNRNNTLKVSNDIMTKESTLNTNLENKNVEDNGDAVSNDSESNSIDTSFTQLAKDIKYSGGVLNLTHNYTYNSSKDASYRDGIEINNNLIINGNNYVIDGSNTAKVFYINSGTVTINNLTITNCSSNYGGAIDNYGISGSLNVNSSSFINCSSTLYGGAILNDGSSLNVTGSSFINCLSNFSSSLNVIGSRLLKFSLCYGGAINNEGGSLSVTGSNFINCSSPNGYGGAINNYGGMIVNGSSFINCSSIYGGAIYNYCSNLNVVDSSFINCSSNYGGAINNVRGSLNVNVSSFINCSSRDYGGAIRDYRSSLNVKSSIFDNCTSSNGTISIESGNYNLNGNYWCVNCTTTEEFKASSLIIENTNSVAPDNWVVMNITNSSEIIVGKNNRFSATLNTLQDGTDYYSNLPDYETVINDDIDKVINVNITNGSGDFNYTPTSAGNFSLVAKSLNSGNLLTNSTFTTFKSDKLNTTIVASDMEITVNSTKNLTTYLKDENGIALVNKNVTFTLKGATYTRITDANGEAKLNITSGFVGIYPVTITFAGDDNYESSNTTVTIKN